MVTMVEILSCVGVDIVMDFAVRMKGRTNWELDATVELDRHSVVAEAEVGRENEVYLGNNVQL